jgi:hypothetical protein
MDRPKLVQWATLGQGSFAPKISELIARQQEARSRRSRLVELLIMLGLLLIPVDIALRRIQIA